MLQGSSLFVHDVRTGATTSLGTLETVCCIPPFACQAGPFHVVAGDRVLFRHAQDGPILVYDSGTGSTTDTGIGSVPFCENPPVCQFDAIVLSGTTVAARQAESTLDLNGAGDLLDPILRIHDLATGLTEERVWIPFPLELLEAIQGYLYRYPAIDPRGFREAMEEILGHPGR